MSEKDYELDDRLGRAITARRAWMGMKRKDLAAAAGLSYPYVAEIENGTKAPSTRALRLLAAALEVTPGELLTDAESVPETLSSPPPVMSAPAVRSAPGMAAVASSMPSMPSEAYDSFDAVSNPRASAWKVESRYSDRDPRDALMHEVLAELKMLRRRLDYMEDDLRAVRSELRGRGDA